jgi:hypothetical protein
MTKNLHYLLVVLAAFFPGSAATAYFLPRESEEKILVIGAHLEGRLDDRKESGYTALLDRILPADGSSLYIKLPLVRAIREFDAGERTCLFPTSASAVASLVKMEVKQVIESAPIDFVSSHFMSAKGKPVINNWQEARENIIAVQRGVEVGAVSIGMLDENIIRTPDDTMSLRMLGADRVDAMYGWVPDAFILAKRERMQLPDFNPDFVIFQTTTHLVCKVGIGAEPLIEHVSARIQTLKASGELKKILSPFARIVDE